MLVNQYNSTLSSVIDQHAPLNPKTVKTRPQVPWYSEEIGLAKRRRQKAENKPADLLLFNKMKYHATFIMNRARKKFYADFINENGTDQGRLSRATEKLLAPIDDLCFSEYNDNSLLDNDIGRFFFLKTDKIRKGLDTTDIEPNELSRLLPVDSAVENKLLGFHLLSQEDVFQLVQRSAKKMCPLDPMPTSMVVNCQDKLLSVITCMINSSLSSGYFSPGWKNAPVSPFRKKPGHYNSFQNLRPVSNLQLVSKLTERTVHNQIHSHMEDTEQFSLYPLLQSAIRNKS